MPNIGIVTTPSTDDSFAEPVVRFVSVLEPTAESLQLFAGGVVVDDAHILDRQIIDIGDGEYFGVALVDYLMLQVVLCIHLVRHRQDLDLLYFHKGAMGLVLPVIIARIFRIRTCAIKVGAFHDERTDAQSLVATLLTLAQRGTFWAANGAVVFTECEVKSVRNENVFVAFSNYRDFDEFATQIPFDERPVDLGFVGRFNEVKGAIRVAKAAVTLVESEPELSVRLIGGGPHYDRVERLVAEYDRITLTGWVNHADIATEHNQIQLLVAPSKAEGLPTVLVEAMGCGVVVLATPVGSVADLITDGETGFHLPDRNPKTIVQTYNRIRDREDLASIGGRAREHVVRTYSKDAAQNRFAAITESLTNMSVERPHSESSSNG